MGLFGLFKKREYEDNEDDDQLEDIEDFIYDRSEVLRNMQMNSKRRNSYLLDEDEEQESVPAEKIPKKLEPVNLNRYSKSELRKYINQQCDIMEEASRHIESAKEEYTAVTSYFSDIQLLETAPRHIQKSINECAQTIHELFVDRRIFQSSEGKLSAHAYAKMEQIEPDMPNGLKELQKNETYFEMVKKDVRMLEGERMALRYDARDAVRRQRSIRKLSVCSMFGLLGIFAVFIITGLYTQEENNYMFLAVLALAALLALGIFAFLKMTERQVIVTEIKLNRAMSLLNKTKIKYINSSNVLNYQYEKYGIKNSYELSRRYETYLEMKSEKQKLSKMTAALNSAEVELETLLKSLKLYDPHIWLAQVKALINPKEMVEVRHELAARRQKLRMQIEYNQNRLEEAKQEIKRVTISNSEFTQEVLEIIGNYEKRNR